MNRIKNLIWHAVTKLEGYLSWLAPVVLAIFAFDHLAAWAIVAEVKLFDWLGYDIEGGALKIAVLAGAFSLICCTVLSILYSKAIEAIKGYMFRKDWDLDLVNKPRKWRLELHKADGVWAINLMRDKLSIVAIGFYTTPGKRYDSNPRYVHYQLGRVAIGWRKPKFERIKALVRRLKQYSVTFYNLKGHATSVALRKNGDLLVVAGFYRMKVPNLKQFNIRQYFIGRVGIEIH